MYSIRSQKEKTSLYFVHSPKLWCIRDLHYLKIFHFIFYTAYVQGKHGKVLTFLYFWTILLKKSKAINQYNIWDWKRQLMFITLQHASFLYFFFLWLFRIYYSHRIFPPKHISSTLSHTYSGFFLFCMFKLPKCLTLHEKVSLFNTI